MQTTLEAALALLKKVEDALSERVIDRNCYCRWGTLYQEVADFLDSAHAENPPRGDPAGFPSAIG